MPQSRARRPKRPKQVGQTGMDQTIHQIRGLIVFHGWAITGVGAYGKCSIKGCTNKHGDDKVHDPSLYTVGLSARGLPELVLRQVEDQTAAAILNGLAGLAVHSPNPLQPGVHYRLTELPGLTFTVNTPEPVPTKDFGMIWRVYPRQAPQIQIQTVEVGMSGAHPR